MDFSYPNSFFAVNQKNYKISNTSPWMKKIIDTNSNGATESNPYIHRVKALSDETE